MQRRAWLILHGKQAQNEAVREAVQACRERGWELAVRLTWEAGDARRLVEEGLRAGYPCLIAGGGDGTLNEVASALIELQGDASLALLPLGSAEVLTPAAMVNLLGVGVRRPARLAGVAEALADEAVHLHLYGKRDVVERRKMGHLTALADADETTADALIRAQVALERLSWMA